MGQDEVPSTVELPIFQVQKKKFCKASMDARVTCCKLAIVAAEYAYENAQVEKVDERQPRPLRKLAILTLQLSQVAQSGELGVDPIPFSLLAKEKDIKDR